MRSIPSLDIYLVPWSVLLRAIRAWLLAGKPAKSFVGLQPFLSNRRSVSIVLALTLLAALGTANAGSKFDLEPVNAACLPDASGSVTFLSTEEERGVDVLRIAVGDLTTSVTGTGAVSVRSIIGEAFSSAVAGSPPARLRADLDHVVMWFADPAEVPSCFDFQGSTPFDGGGIARPAALSSRDATGLEAFPE